MQAYRGLDIGTAKPGGDVLDVLPHHLINIRNPNEQYTAGEFVTLADSLCARISRDSALPVVAGGTGFYVRNFLCGLPAAPAADSGQRRAVELDLAAKGPAALRAELAASDPVSAARIHEHDLYRLTRAVEILRTTGRPPSEFAPAASVRSGYDFLVIGVDRPREELGSRIDRRVDSMFALGLRAEVEALIAAGYGPDCPAMAAIGYREFFESPGEPDTVVARRIKLHTRQYAKRQMTFLRSLPGIRWIPPDPLVLARLVSDFLGSASTQDCTQSGLNTISG